MNICDAIAFFPLSYAAWSDCKQRIIPDWTVAIIFALAALKVILHLQSWQFAVLGAAIGIVPLIVAMIDESSMGGGDIKLIAALCALSGPSDGLMLLAVAFLCAAILGASLRQSRLPLAPFLCGAFSIFKIALLFL